MSEPKIAVRPRGAYSRFDWADAAPVREHVQSLVDLGYSKRAIAQTSGVPYSTILALLKGYNGSPRTKVMIENAEALLRTNPLNLPPLREPAPPKPPRVVKHRPKTRYETFLKVDYERSAREVAEILGVTVRAVRYYRRRRREEQSRA